MKVCILASGYPPDIRGGGELSTEILAEALAKLGCQVHVLCCAQEPGTQTINDVTVERIASPNIYWSFRPQKNALLRIVWHLLDNFNPRAFLIVRDRLDKLTPDIFVTSTIENFGASAWAAAMSRRIKTVHILRSYYVLCWRGTVFKQSKRCNGLCLSCRVTHFPMRTIANKLDAVISLSNATLRRHKEEGLFRETSNTILHATVLPDPVNVSATADENKRARNNPIKFGYLGFLTSNKGIETIADALKRLPKNVECNLLIAGTGKPAYVSELEQLFTGTATQFVGWQNAQNFLKTIDYLIVPSVWEEPFGRIVVEAFAEGVPVIGSKSGGIGEMVTPGINGYVFQPGDAGELSDAIAQATAQTPADYTKMSYNAAKSAADYVGTTVAQKYIDFFKDIIAKKAV